MIRKNIVKKLDKVLDEYNVRTELKGFAKELIEKIEEEGLRRGRKDKTVISSIVYLTSIFGNNWITQKEIAKELNATPTQIIKFNKLVREKIDLIDLRKQVHTYHSRNTYLP